MIIPFNKSENSHLKKIILSKLNNLDSNGKFSKRCESFLKNKYKSKKVLMTNSCTSALEICSYLLKIKKNDEIIFPNYTYVTTANAFVSKGAIPIFSDIRPDTLNIDENKISELINKKTKAIVINHYGSINSEVEKISKICKKNKIVLIEDIADSIFSKIGNRYLGSYGDLATISFHQTKVISCGMGGALLINKKKYITDALNILNKGTNRHQFEEKKIKKYNWVSLGSSLGLSEIHAKILFENLKNHKKIINQRVKAFNIYHKNLKTLEDDNYIQLPLKKKDNKINGVLFFIIVKKEKDRDKLINYLKNNKIHSVSHYEVLNKSPFYKKNFIIKTKTMVSDNYSKKILRLPMFLGIKFSEQKKIIETVKRYFSNV